MAFTNEELCLLIQKGDSGHLPQLWEQVRRFIAVKARRFHRRSRTYWQLVDVEDLVQAGYFAVLEAVKYYSPEKGLKFTTYLNQTLKTAFAEVAGCRTSKRDLLAACASLDAPVEHEGETPLLEMVLDPDAAEPFEGIVEDEYTRQLRAALDAALEILPERDRELLRLHYYFGWSIHRISNVKCISPAGLADREQRALTKIRNSSHRAKLAPFMYWYADEDCFQLTGFQTWGRAVR